MSRVEIGELFQLIRIVAGFFDFVVFIALLVVALAIVRKRDARLGYLVGGAAALRFLTTCCANVGQALELGDAFGDAGWYATVALQLVSAVIELGVWVVVLYALTQLSRAAPT